MDLGRENETTEFKESLTQLDKGIKSLTAMLNKSGRGSVYFGVDDTGKVKGVSVGPDTLMKIRRKLQELVEPAFLWEITPLKDENGKNFIQVSALGSDTPYSCDGRYYVRNVAADEKASNELLRRMLSSGDSDLICRMESEEQNLSFKQLISLLAAKGIHTRTESSLLESYKLMDKYGHYNLMAYLCSDKNGCRINVVRFAGIDKTAMAERTDFGHCCLLLSVKRVLEYAHSLNTVRVDLSDGVRRECPLFSYAAFREAWINACLHNRWGEFIPPAVHIFDDRIEIISYGGLPYGLSPDRFFVGTSMPVNRSLLTLFIAVGLAEQSGHGIPAIVEAYGKEAFSFKDGIVKVTLRFAYEPEVVAMRRQMEREQARLSNRQRCVLAFLAGHPDSTLANAAPACGLSLAGIKKVTARLQQLGLLVRTGSRKKGSWQTFCLQKDSGAD